MTRLVRPTLVHGAAAVLALALAGCRTAVPAGPAPSPAPTPSTRPARPAAPAFAVPIASLSEHRVIPVPTSVTPAAGAPFTLGSGTTVVVTAGNADATRVAEALVALLRPPTGLPLPVTASDAAAPNGAIVLRLGGPASLGAEGYELTISADSARILATNPAGLFHGVQTLRQLLPPLIEADLRMTRSSAPWSVPAGRITDTPRFAWRGMMLDVARHFFTVDEVKQVIDLLALYKLNTLHLHLADDQGWRVQIDSWPKLTSVSSATEVGGGPGGFYTKAEYADLVRYGQERYVTIVPEIDMPGHTNAAIAAYPELKCSRPTPGGGGANGAYTGTEVGWSTFCPDSEITYKFVDDIVREIGAMSPSPYFHVGGDEVHVLSDAQYVTFVERVQDIVYKNGKTMIGWEEVGKAKLRPTSVAQQWKSDTVPPAVLQGAKLVMSPSDKAYFDMKYDRNTEIGLDWAALIELRQSYDWEPVTYLKGIQESQVLGVEGALWSETLQNLGAAQYMMLPRLPALAEIGWSPAASKNWESFRQRIAAQASRWHFLGANYYRSTQVDW
jgi:hexosaminidase